MLRKLKGIVSIASISLLTISVVPAANAEAPGWRSGAGYFTGASLHTGAEVSPEGESYMCAADGGTASVTSKSVTQGHMNPAAPVNSLDVRSLGGNRSATITDATQLGQMAYVASTADISTDESAATAQIAIIRAAGMYEGSVYEQAEHGTYASTNADKLKSPAENSAALAKEAERYGGPYTVQPTLDLPDGATGSVGNVGAKSAAGNWLAGYSYTLEITGPAVFESTGTTTVTGTTATATKAEAIRATASGEVTVELTVKDLPTSKAWISTGVIGNATIQNQRAQNFIILNKKESLNGRASVRSTVDFSPQIATTVKSAKINKGDALVDTVTASADNWINVPGTDTPAPVTATVDVYGPFASPVAPTTDGTAFASKKLGSYQLTFTGPGTQDTEGSITAPEEGFYFFQAHVDKDAQGEYAAYINEYGSEFFELSETTVAPWTPSITSKATQEDLGNGKAGIKDVITVTGMPEDHTSFNGIQGWKADAQTITHSLYFVPKQTELKEGVTEGLTALATVETPAKNGEYTINAADFPIDWDLGVGTYIVVSTYAGDSRTVAVTTSDMDENEQVSPTFGKVTTKAFSEKGGTLQPGDKIADTVTLTGSFPQGSYTEVQLYTWAKDSAPTCDTPVWTTRLDHGGMAGEYKTELYTTESGKQATYGYVETTYDRNGNVISQGTCGESDETLTTSQTAPTLPKTAKLPKTGANVTGIAAVAVALVLLGSAGVVLRRRSAKA
ncbi:MAG: LPXTG cell wall anchor domain-containing protein [Actinomycetaceae bacterium]|nr:LPXTG cell wall anchor domain-containing protein [Actinomycetaceae bacterium]